MENRTSKNILLTIMGVLILADIVATVLAASSTDIILTLSKIISLIFIALYGFWLYKKPHGNVLKYAMLLLAATQIVNAAKCIQLGYNTIYINIIRLFVTAIIIYVAGRLNRIEQNKYLLSIAAVVQILITIVIVISVAYRITPLLLFTWFSGAISIVTLMIAYFVRFKEHKEAGLIDAPRK